MERRELTIRVNGHQFVFNVLYSLKYPDEEITECSLISSWDTLILKQLLKGTDMLRCDIKELRNKDIIIKKQGGKY